MLNLFIDTLYYPRRAMLAKRTSGYAVAAHVCNIYKGNHEQNQPLTGRPCERSSGDPRGLVGKSASDHVRLPAGTC